MANFCSECGSRLDDTGKCPKCNTSPPTPEAVSGSVKNFTDKVTGTINKLAGEDGAVNLKIKDLFVQVFKKHSPEESEEIFVSGTSKTTPPENKISTTWPKPWLYSRVFIMLAVTFLLLYICLVSFNNLNALPGMIFMGAIAVPFSLIIFFMEVNAPRNISFFDIMKIFFVGGGASLLVALILYTFVSTEGFLGAIIIGIVEESAKFAIAAYFIHKTTKAKYILNGILIGAAVGAGFATFETAGYILNWGLNAGADVMMDVLFLRAFLAPGGHVVWSAILGGAIMLVKGEQPFKMSQLSDKRFLSFAGLAVAMHAIWDMPIEIFYIGSISIVHIVLSVMAWVIVLVLVSVGLKEISKKINNSDTTPMPEEKTEINQIDDTVISI